MRRLLGKLYGCYRGRPCVLTKEELEALERILRGARLAGEEEPEEDGEHARHQ